MQPEALAPYERSLLTHEPLRLHHEDGRPLTPLHIDRWLGRADLTDQLALEQAVAPVLDVGCGPGRILAALAGMGQLALGVDIAATAVALARQQGLLALRRSVFEPLPREAGWATVVLLDGNIGIGGDPIALLQRVRRLLVARGRVIVETDADAAADERVRVRFTRTGEPIEPPFAWAHLGLNALVGQADALGFTVRDSWTSAGRAFAVLTT